MKHNKSGNNNKKSEPSKIAQEFVNALNKGVLESSERHERWDKIYAIEKTKWPYGMGKKMRQEIPKKLHPKLDKCIEKSQKIARKYCQTAELTKEYLEKNTHHTTRASRFAS